MTLVQSTFPRVSALNVVSTWEKEHSEEILSKHCQSGTPTEFNMIVLVTYTVKCALESMNRVNLSMNRVMVEIEICWVGQT